MSNTTHYPVLRSNSDGSMYEAPKCGVIPNVMTLFEKRPMKITCKRCLRMSGFYGVHKAKDPKAQSGGGSDESKS